MSHNGSGYDNYFLINWLISNSIKPEVIFKGTKIMYMLVPRGLNIKVLDTLNFLPMKLAKFPKAFGLTEMKKGYFPHFFNKEENQDYIGPYPDKAYYGCDYMSTEDRTNFLKWYDGTEDKVFDFATQMREYCCSDTSILREGLLKFRDLMLDVTGEKEQLNPKTGQTESAHGTGIDILDFITIASVCMGIYKSKFLQEEFENTGQTKA